MTTADMERTWLGFCAEAEKCQREHTQAWRRKQSLLSEKYLIKTETGMFLM